MADNEDWIESDDQELLDSVTRHEGARDSIFGMIDSGILTGADRCDVEACRQNGTWPAYIDSEGLDTVGVGHLITGREDYDCYAGVSDDDVMRQLADDLRSARDGARRLAESNDMNATGNYTVQRFMTELCFNIGEAGYGGFRNGLRKLAAAVNGTGEFSYGEAAEEHLDSKWARQVGDRAIEMTDTLRALD